MRILVTLAALVLCWNVSSSPVTQNTYHQVKFIFSFSYIKFLRPDAWNIELSCCPTYISSRSENEIIIKTLEGTTIKGFFNVGQGLYICGNAAHILGYPEGNFPLLILLVGKDEELGL